MITRGAWRSRGEASEANRPCKAKEETVRIEMHSIADERFQDSRALRLGARHRVNFFWNWLVVDSCLPACKFSKEAELSCHASNARSRSSVQ